MSDVVHEVTQKVGLAFELIKTIQSVTHVGGAQATAAIEVIAKMIEAFDLGMERKLSVEEVRKELDFLHAKIDDADSAADAALEARFKKEKP